LDSESPEFHARVREAYLRIAQAEPDRLKVIETDQPVEATHQRVKEIIIPFLTSRGHPCRNQVDDSVATEVKGGK
jgi:dTMP kinase